MNTPTFITFTGLDDRTDLSRAKRIARRWPVEWAVLFSPKRQGADQRYPSEETISHIWWSNFPRLAVHLCGRYSQAVMAGARFNTPADLGYAKRVQVNHIDPNPTRIREFAKGWGVRGVAQARGLTFPRDNQVDWLFDVSGGHGLEPASWPTAPTDERLVGYAGGINPINAGKIAASLSGAFWLDMESGVRTDDWLDLDKCEAVCRAVFV